MQTLAGLDFLHTKNTDPMTTNQKVSGLNPDAVTTESRYNSGFQSFLPVVFLSVSLYLIPELIPETQKHNGK